MRVISSRTFRKRTVLCLAPSSFLSSSALNIVPEGVVSFSTCLRRYPCTHKGTAVASARSYSLNVSCDEVYWTFEWIHTQAERRPCAIHHSDASNWSITLEVLQRFIHGVAQHLYLELSAAVTFKILARQRVSCGCCVCCICCRTTNYFRALVSNGVALSKSFSNGSYEAPGVACAA